MRQYSKARLQGAAAWVCALLLWGAPVAAQQRAVRGTVLSETNEPVPSANVVVKGTRIGVLTGAGGEFMLQVPDANDTLVVSSVGYAPSTVPLAGRTTLTIRLTVQAVLLDQVVAVGYGTQKRSDVTGSVGSVGSGRLETSKPANVVEALEGAVAGLSVTTNQSNAEGDFSILIRGQNSINASNTPLVIVDGIPYGGTFSELNPAEIESIDVLKDASAAAIYGARGSNGVILITTKKGSGKPKVRYSGTMGTANAVDIPQMMSGQDFGVFKCTHINNGVPCDQALLESTLTASELANYQAGRTTDWVGLATRTGIRQQHTLSFSGGSDQSRYYISGGLLNNQGVALNDTYRRYDLRVNLEQQMNSWLKMGTNTQMGLVNRSGLEADFSAAFLQNPLNSAFDSTGGQIVYPWPEDVFFPNPLQGLLVTDDDNSRRVFTSNHLDVTFPFIQGLSFRVNGGIDYEDRQRGRYYGRDTRTGYAAQGSASTNNTYRLDWTLENLLRYQRNVGKHTFDFTALYSQEGNTYRNDALASSGFPNDVLTYYQAYLGQVITPSYSYSKSGLISQMARLNYNYADKYLVTATARRDGFSGFGKEHKYGTFPSFALGWNVAKEGFWRWQEQVPALKLRLSWGQNGNEAISPYQTLARLDDQSYIDGQTTAPGFISVSLANPDLRWEATTQTDAGVDFGLLGNRIQGSFDAYWSRTHDLLLNRAISPVHGVSSVLQNIGKTANRGVELNVTTRNVKTKQFSWETTFNISANRNRIVDLYGNGQDDVGNGWFIGHPIDVNFGYVFDGIWQQNDNIAGSAQPKAKPGDVKIKDVNGDGKIDPTDRVIQGSLQPSYLAGLSNTFRYRALSLSAFLNTVQGITRANPLLSPTVVGPQVRYNTIVHDWWTPQNPINTYPANREGVTGGISVPFYQSSSYIRLQDVTLGLQVPGKVSQRYGVESLRLYVDAKNLWTGTKWTGLDPEFTTSHQRDVPLSRTIMFGLDVGF